MKYYQELTLIAQAEVSLYVIWSKLYTQLHLAFVEQKD
ncbi:MAG TPA: type I-F CRISPR-associated endoribonuclease Cas6/Csy4, partial [Agitococcus sp.]|nr:type I-F CRISPR-associated endoribonuclease Cas6/Csy4 [Agitococcus sp.]